MQLFLNNWSAALTVAATDADTAMTVAPEAAALLGEITPGDHYVATLEVEAGIEIVHITATADGELTVLRAQEGTAALFLPAGSVLEMRITAATLVALQSSGGGAGGGGGAFGIPRVPAGQIFCPLEHAVTTALTTSYTVGFARLTPFDVPIAMTIDQIGVRVSTASSGGTVQMALYDSDADGWPTDRLGATSVSAAATSIIMGDLSSGPVELQPGKTYWLATKPVGAMLTLGMVHTRSFGEYLGNPAQILQRNLGSSGLPSNWGGFSSDDLNAFPAPLTYVRRSA